MMLAVAALAWLSGGERETSLAHGFELDDQAERGSSA